MAARLVILTLLASIGFYNYHDMMALPAQRAVFMFMLIVMAGYAVVEKHKSLRAYDYPRVPWLLFLTLVVVSIFMSTFYHPQTLMQSAIATSTSIFAYGSFFVLLYTAPDPGKIIKYLFWVSGVSILIYFVNVVTFPHNMFGVPIMKDLSRGIMRIPVPLLQVILLLVFYSINQWQLTRRYVWVVFVGIGFTMIFLSVIRQVIAIMSLLCFLQVLQRLSWVRKVLIGTAIAAVGYVVIINLPMYKAMKELSEEQINDNEVQKEDVRIGAWRYYAWEGHEHPETLLFGNGTPSFDKSVWGKFFSAFTEDTGYLTADISWGGLIYMYGYIAVLSLLAILVLAIKKKKTPDKQYLNYFLVATILQGIASGVLYYFYEIFVIMIALYLVYSKGETDRVSLPATGGDAGKMLQPRHRFVTR